MTKQEFLNNIPSIIEHKTWGFGKIEVVSDKPEIKGVCYRHDNKLASGGNYASTWKELYSKMVTYLKE